MKDEGSFPSNMRHIDINSYIKCAGKGCNDLGVYFLSCESIHRIGMFCDSCRVELEESGYVDSTC